MVVESPLISVIMPAFNVEKYIKEAIDSILNQTYPHFELLICDDGSSDKTWEVINSYDDIRIRKYQNSKNIGNLKTSNHLFSECGGEYITIQDADDYSDIHRFDKYISYLKLNPFVGILGTNYITVDQSGYELICGNLPKGNEKIKMIMEKEIPPLLFASVIIRRDISEKVGYFRPYFDRKGYADTDWLARCIEVSEVDNLPFPSYFYRKHEDSFNSFYNKKSKSLVEKNMHTLLVKAHLLRCRGEEDYFSNNGNLRKIKREVSNIYLRKAENNYWDDDRLRFKKNIKRSLFLDLFNFKVYRLLFYVLKKRIK